jgi:hypothetical protein
LPYVPLIPKLLYLQQGDSMLGLGYPGHDIASIPVNLERIDTGFYGFSWQQDSSCAGKSVVENCGVRYQSRRYKDDYKALYDVPTDLGLYTDYFRGGFSGGPIFYKGYVAGIMLTSREDTYSNLYDLGYVGQWNWVDSLSSEEIVTALAQQGISVPLAP